MFVSDHITSVGCHTEFATVNSPGLGLGLVGSELWLGLLWLGLASGLELVLSYGEVLAEMNWKILCNSPPTSVNQSRWGLSDIFGGLAHA